MLEGRYRIDAPIARGGMSMVFRGVDTRLDRPVAIKVMDPKFASDPQFLSRFEFEARAVAKLKHPSLVAVYDQGVDGEFPFLIMELVEGGTLRELLRERGPMPPHAVRAVAEPLLAALGVAHAAGLVHRDIKPENVLISDSGEVKIADFGLVRAVAAASTTSASVVLGTAAYLSPEQVMSGSADSRSDVYASGVLIFELLTGQVPFTGDNSLAIAYQRVEKDVPPPSRFIGGIPPEFDELVANATARDPEGRFADANEMGARLRAIAAELRLPPYRVPAPQESAEHVSASYRPAPEPVRQAHAAPAPDAAQHTRMVTAQRPRVPDYGPVDGYGPPDQPTGLRQPTPFQTYAPDPRQTRRTTLVWVAIVAVLTLIVGVGGWWLGFGRYESVPPIAGLTADQATAELREAGFDTEIRQKASDTVPVGGVVGSDPSAGAKIGKGSTVAVLVSSGKPRVPEIAVGDQVSKVNQLIRDAGLQPVDAGETGSQAPKGTLARVEPASGTVLPMGAQVKVYRSSGAQPVKVPDVRGKSTEDAVSALGSAGLKVGETRTDYDKQLEADQVIGTDPAAGSTLSRGDSVTLVVSNAVKMPFVVGQSVGDARARLQNLGLTVQVQQLTPSDNSVVIGQSPGANSKIAPGSTVNLTALP
ncbi:Stk1 family PASTA domain-containing Ser/Thr kinase [Nocardia bovistercoris]|uniref:non-specific serine/threonine protein kinase n=1 Tax=Nocardia bovistercoris TaxID=2785916 RepID=A0A931IEQ2_9NOCA|nr:Stk1 family PASTA domain-containing Ser/Thr kinase [Nocardia bovistercoris]MBH0780074.1 Stk1 family PASTA domain-containing Ser/Thr kinase [Nocardia bovistercoris]